MQQAKVNINIAVDVVKALSEKTLCNNIFMMDNSVWNSTGQGTSYLSTFCQPGQTIHWVVYAIDLQTPVAIKNITFIGTGNDCTIKDEMNCTCREEDDPDSKEWTGIVPWYMVPRSAYRYRLELQMGEGPQSILHIDTPALMRV